jgi:hypothetical protein
LKHNNDAKNEYYTGNVSKKLFVHVMQDGIEVAKPIKAKIYDQHIVWNKRQYPIIPDRFYYDHKGIAHQQVASNDVSVLTYKKDHEDNCKKCGGKMTIDARQARMLGRSGVFHAIWGIDSSHMILIIIFAIGAMAMTAFAFYSYNQDTLHKTQLESANKEIARLNQIINPTPVNPNVNPDGSITNGRR